MPDLTLIQIKRSIGVGATDAPGVLANGELAYTTNGEILYIGGDAEVVPLGGRRFPGVLTANHALVANSTSWLDKIQPLTVELGHVSDTTLSRSGAGILAVEGVDVPTISSSETLTNKTIDAGIFTGVTDVQQSFELSGDISPAALASQTDNWAPSGLATTSAIRVLLTGAQSITGLTGGADGRLMIIHNIDTADILTLADESGASTAANRFAIGSNLALNPDESVLLHYDSTTSRWRSLAGPSTSAALGDHLTDLDALSAVSGADEVMISTGAGTWAFESGDTAAISLGLGSSDGPQFNTIELGHASDTTLSRSGVGVLAVEGVDVVSNTGGIQDLVTVGAVGGDSEFLVGTGAGVLAWEAAATAATSMGLGTASNPQFATIELGHASDTTIARVGAGVISVEGVTVPSVGSALEWTAIQSFVITDAADDVKRPAIIGHMHTGSSAAGIGAGLQFNVEVADGEDLPMVYIDAVTTDVGAGTEDVDIVFSTANGGGIPSEAFRIGSTGVLTTVGVIELENADTTLARAGAGSLSVEGVVVVSNVGVVQDLIETGAAGADSDFLVGTAAGAMAWEAAATALVSMGAQAQGDVLDDLNTTGAVGGDSEFLVGTAAGAMAWENAATARASIGAGTGDGDVTASGSPLNGELAVWTSGTDVEGDALLTFATGTSDLTVFGPAGTGAAAAGVLSLSTNEPSVASGTSDQLGRIDWQAPLETGADAILVSASIWAEAAIDFDATNNATDLVFALGVSEAAAEKARLSSAGNWTITGSFTAGTSDLANIGLTGSAGEFDTALQSDTFVFTSEVGSVVQAFGDVLDDLNATGAVGADSEFLVGTGAGTMAWENAATAATSLGLGSASDVQFRDVTATGNLVVSGTLTTIDTTNLVVQDPLIKLANGNSTSDVIDIGFYGLMDDSGAQDVYSGLFRDASDSDKWKLFKLLEVEPTTTVDTGGAGYAQDTLVCSLESDNVLITGGSIDAGTF